MAWFLDRVKCLQLDKTHSLFSTICGIGVRMYKKELHLDKQLQNSLTRAMIRVFYKCFPQGTRSKSNDHFILISLFA
jgi:hypothetical protein